MRQMLVSRKFGMKKIDEKDMFRKGFFRRIRTINNIKYVEYTYEFPVYFWKKYPVLICYLRVNEDTHRVDIDVTTKDGDFYHPFYFDNGSAWDDHIEEIEKQILKMFKRLGIRELKIRKQHKVIKGGIHGSESRSKTK